MTVLQLVKHLGISESRFYRLRLAGVIPSPLTGAFVRKHYSAGEIRSIKAKLKELGEIE